MDGQTQQPETNVTINATLEFHAPDGVGTPAPAKASVEQLVEDWFRKHFHGLGARVDESLYNHLHAAKEELKQILARV